MLDQKMEEGYGYFFSAFLSSWLVRISYIGCTPPLPCCLLPCNISKRGRQSNHNHHHPPARPQFLSLFLGTFIFDQHHALPPHFIFSHFLKVFYFSSLQRQQKRETIRAGTRQLNNRRLTGYLE